MKNLWVFFLLLAVTVSVSCHRQQQSETVAIPGLGFRYTPPPGMEDQSPSESLQLRTSAASYTGSAAALLLHMTSGKDAQDPQWHDASLIMFPHSQLPNLTDPVAEAKLNEALASPATPTGPPQLITIGERSFVVSQFAEREPSLKHATIFTTICKTQLVSFVFVSNSKDQLKAMQQSLRTLDFSGQ